MNILTSNFLTGPNIHHRESTVVLSCEMGGLLSLLVSSSQTKVPAALYELWSQLSSQTTGDSVLDRMLAFAMMVQLPCSVRAPDRGVVLSADGNKIRVAIPCEIPNVGIAAWQFAAACAANFCAAENDTSLANAAIQAETQFRAMSTALCLDMLTLAMVRAADARGVPWTRLGFPHRFVQLGHGRFAHRLHETLLSSTDAFALRLANNKAATNQMLQRFSLPLPVQYLVSHPDHAAQAATMLGYPVVVKPCTGSKGAGVSVGLTDAAQVRQAFALAAQHAELVLLESLVLGDDHRLLVVGGKLIAAARRLSARVIGDGVSSIADLINALNLDPRRGPPYLKLMETITVDHETVEVLAQQGLTPHSVLTTGRTALLRRTANISRGGTAIDVTDSVHPDNIQMAQEVARVIGLNVAGIDFLTTDISRSWRDVGGGIIEVNGNPGLRPHWIDDTAKRDVVEPILDLIMSHENPCRIPTVAITGSIGKTTTCRMVAHILAAGGHCVGLSTTQGTYVGERLLQDGDHGGGRAAANLLLHPEIDAGVFEIARGGLLNTGLHIDRVAVAAVLNVLDNHVGVDGVSSVEDMARVKRVVAESATEFLVLNADDAHCTAMRTHARAQRICWYSRVTDSPVGAGDLPLARHDNIDQCIIQLITKNNETHIVLTEANEEVGRINITKIPATMHGIAIGKAVNAAFAIAIAHGLNIPFAQSAKALRSFASTPLSNPGRLNLLKDLPFTAIVDCPDGFAAAKELANVAGSLKIKGKRVLVLTAPGNRPDAYIVNTARALAGAFDFYLCSNFVDLRGRAADEVPQLLQSGLLESGVAGNQIFCLPALSDALEHAVSTMHAEDLMAVGTCSTAFALRHLQALTADKM